MPESPGLTEEDVELWRRVMNDAAPLRGQPESKKAAPVAPARPAPPGKSQGCGAPRPRDERPLAPGGVDRRTLQRLRRGQIPIDSKIDLHGMTQAEAHRVLTRRIAAAQDCGERCLLVITGKGDIGGETGVLRLSAPRWLREEPNAARVLAFAAARARHGGAGALYVYLRKARR